MSNTNLRFQLRAVNVPATLPHKMRSEEIEELPEYIEVFADIAPGLSLISVGEEEPPADRAEFPWVKLNSQGEPLGLFVNVGGTWEPVSEKFFVREITADTVVERGTQTINMNIAANTAQTYTDEIEFSEDYDDIPEVRINIIGGNILSGSGTGSGYYTTVIPSSIKVGGFSIIAISPVDTSSAAKTVEIAWEARGRREDVN